MPDQIVSRLLRFRCCREDRPLVCFQDPEPGGDVLGVILAWFTAQAEMCAYKGSGQFGYKLFHGVGVIAEPLPKLRLYRCGFAVQWADSCARVL